MFNKKIASFFVLLILLGLLFLFLLGFTIQFNSEGILPAGVYRAIHSTVQRGDIVESCLPRIISTYARMRDYIGTGSCPGSAGTVTLIVAGMSPDTVTLKQDSVSINGTPLPDSATQEQDHKKRYIPAIPRGVYPLSEGQLWLMGDQIDSWDSRYFGSIDKIQIRSILRPIITI